MIHKILITSYIALLIFSPQVVFSQTPPQIVNDGTKLNYLGVAEAPGVGGCPAGTKSCVTVLSSTSQIPLGIITINGATTPGGMGTGTQATLGVIGSITPCYFAGSTTAGDYVSFNSSGQCTDSGATAVAPNIGQVQTTGSGAGVRAVLTTLGVFAAIGGNVSGATVVATGGVTARALAAMAGDKYNILSQTGVDPTGVADSTTGIQAAYTAACAVSPAGKKAVYWPGGAYVLSATLTIPCSNVSSIFDGSNTVELAPSSCYGDIFYVGANPIAGYQAGNHFLGGFRLFRSDNCSSGAVIHMVASQLATIEDVEDTGQFGGLLLEQPLNVKISRFRVDGNNSTSGSYGCTIQNPSFTATTHGTISITGVPTAAYAYIFTGEAIYGTDIPANDTIASFNKTAQTITLMTAASGSATGPIGLTINGGAPADVKISDSEFESASANSGIGNGCIIHAADGVYMQKSNFGFSSGPGLLIQPVVPNEGIGGVTCIGCIFDSAGTYGLEITDPSGYASLLGGFNFSDGQYDLSTDDEFYVDSSATALKNVIATGSQFVLNGHSAINLNAGSGFDFSHSNLQGSNQTNSSYPHVLLAGTVANVNLDGAQFLTGQGAHAVPYDVSITSASVTGVVGRGLISKNSATKDLNFSSVGSVAIFEMAATDRVTTCAVSGAGSTGTCTLDTTFSNNDYSGTMLITAGGSGISSNGNLTITTANPAPHAWFCQYGVMAGGAGGATTNWPSVPTFQNTNAPALNPQTFWATGSNLTSGDVYGVNYQCRST